MQIMDESVKLIKEAFPGLQNDSDFKITSPIDPNYNCIAWAYQKKDKYMWPHPLSSAALDGICYWPDEVIKSPDVEAFIEAFRLKGYEICNSELYEKGFQKIALYVKPGTTECTHAARQLLSGKWTSKLGPNHDIDHGSLYSIEGDSYGVLYCVMKRIFE